MEEKELFDDWPERYDDWFKTPVGKLVLETEGKLVMDFMQPKSGEKIFDAGCGTGVFTLDFLATGANVVGLDISAPMLKAAVKKSSRYNFSAVLGDMVRLPFKDNTFDKTASITALEFIDNGRGAVNELFRVTRPGGWVVVATLNSLSPWASRRKAKTERGEQHVLQDAFFRSPSEILGYIPFKGIAKTVVHFQKDEQPDRAFDIEKAGQSKDLKTGAFVAVKWQKPV